MMLPAGDYLPEIEETMENLATVQPGLTYHLRQERLRGYIDELDAVKQAAYLCLATEQESCPIYSKDYGIKTIDLIGAEKGLIIGRLPRRIKEALTQDDRIKDVTDFQFSFPSKDSMEIGFRIHSIYGTVDGSHTVKVG